MSKLKNTPTSEENQSLSKIITAKAKAKAKVERSRPKVQAVRMPATPGGNENEREITVMQASCNSLMIAVEDVPWLVEYVASELNGGNIPEPYDPDDDSADVGSPGDDSAVAGFHCEWSPNGSWRAVVTRGPLKGEDYVIFLRDLTQDKWDRGAILLGMNPPFDDSHKPEQRKVLLAFLEDVVHQKRQLPLLSMAAGAWGPDRRRSPSTAVAEANAERSAPPFRLHCAASNVLRAWAH